jgi:uncharacterized protein
MKLLRRRNILIFLLVLIIGINLVAFLHAYKFTHFSDEQTERTNPKTLSTLDKLKVVAFGVDNPRPKIIAHPVSTYETFLIAHENDTIESWYIPVDSAKGTVIIFHGYAGNKSQMLKVSEAFRGLGYNSVLVDFLGSGGSTGDRTTIGFYESEQVEGVYRFFKERGEERIVLFGTSMGAVAIMKSIKDFHLSPDAIILECPFGNMLETVQARFNIMNAPVFPMSYLLTFWGGVQNNFNPFSHNPEDYAKEIKIKTLLMYGMKDDRVSLRETESIFSNLSGVKALKIYPEAGHESILAKYELEWLDDVSAFLKD